MKFSLITACTRPENLKIIFESINFKCDWYIIFDGRKENIDITGLDFLLKDWIFIDYLEKKPWGYPQRNFALDKIKDGFVYFLDDDNLIHPLFYETTIKILEENKGIKSILYSQKLENNIIRRVDKDSVKVFNIDQGQFLLHVDLIGKKRYSNDHHADGYFIESIYKENPKDVFYFYNENDITFYNKLKWPKEELIVEWLYSL